MPTEAVSTVCAYSVAYIWSRFDYLLQWVKERGRRSKVFGFRSFCVTQVGHTRYIPLITMPQLIRQCALLSDIFATPPILMTQYLHMTLILKSLRQFYV